MSLMTIHFDIPKESPTARMIEQVMAERDVSPSEAAILLLQRPSNHSGSDSMAAVPYAPESVIGSYGIWTDFEQAIAAVIDERDQPTIVP
jgi:hypothetical protein